MVIGRRDRPSCALNEGSAGKALQPSRHACGDAETSLNEGSAGKALQRQLAYTGTFRVNPQ